MRGHQNGSDGPIQCQMHRVSGTITKGQLKEQLYLQDNSEDLRNGSGRAHGWTVMVDGLIGGR